MLADNTLVKFLDEVASKSPAPGGGSVAALAGALGSALISMVCSLTIGKKKYAEAEGAMKNILDKSEKLRKTYSLLIDKDAQAFKKVMEAFELPKEPEAQKALRLAAIQEATKEAALVPLEVMKHGIDALELAKIAAEKGNVNSISDAGVSALMIHASVESAAFNVQINLNGIDDTDFVGWKSEEVTSLIKSSRMKMEEIRQIVKSKISE